MAWERGGGEGVAPFLASAGAWSASLGAGDGGGRRPSSEDVVVVFVVVVVVVIVVVVVVVVIVVVIVVVVVVGHGVLVVIVVGGDAKTNGSRRCLPDLLLRLWHAGHKDAVAAVAAGDGGGGGGGGGSRKSSSCVFETELSLSAPLLVQVLFGDSQLEEPVAGLAYAETHVDKVASKDRHEGKPDGPAEPRGKLFRHIVLDPRALHLQAAALGLVHLVFDVWRRRNQLQHVRLVVPEGLPDRRDVHPPDHVVPEDHMVAQLVLVNRHKVPCRRTAADVCCFSEACCH